MGEFDEENGGRSASGGERDLVYCMCKWWHICKTCLGGAVNSICLSLILQTERCVYIRGLFWSFKMPLNFYICFVPIFIILIESCITIQLSLKCWSVFLALGTLGTALCAVFSGMLVCTLQSHITPAAQSILLNRILQGFVLTTPQLYLFSTDTLLKLSRNAWLKSKLKSYFFCVFIRDWLCIHTAFLRWI